jgi:hypothetical protein
MDSTPRRCPDCDAPEPADRRTFLKAAAASAATLPLWATPRAQAAPTPRSAAETAVKALYDSLTEPQRKEICFEWDHKAPGRGLLRTHVSNNWQITKPHIKSEFYTAKQQGIVHDIFRGITNPDWYGKFLKQLKDDTGGKPWGADQSCAIFGTPGTDKFEFVMTGRHMTIRADGHTENHVAFGGPIFYGHAAQGFNEKAAHPGNVFWHQAVMANQVYSLLDKKQQEVALVRESPHEAEVEFRGTKGGFPGIAVRELHADVQTALQRVLLALIEPYRKEDQDEALACLQRQGGLESCGLAFYKDSDIGDDGVWDNWRLEGPSFVWYFRGNPHVHVWVHVADDPTVKLNAKG